MNNEEFVKVQEYLKGDFRFMFQNREQVLTWWTHLKAISYDDAMRGATRTILSRRLEPSISDYLDDVETAKRDYRRQHLPSNTGKEISCIHCKDTGLIVKEVRATGRMIGKPCTFCERGKERYPWDFLDAKERQEYIDSEAKKGRTIPRYYESPKKDYMLLTFGTEAV